MSLLNKQLALSCLSMDMNALGYNCNKKNRDAQAARKCGDFSQRKITYHTDLLSSTTGVPTKPGSTPRKLVRKAPSIISDFVVLPIVTSLQFCILFAILSVSTHQIVSIYCRCTKFCPYTLVIALWNFCLGCTIITLCTWLRRKITFSINFICICTAATQKFLPLYHSTFHRTYERTPNNGLRTIGYTRIFFIHFCPCFLWLPLETPGSSTNWTTILYCHFSFPNEMHWLKIIPRMLRQILA